TKKKAGGRRCRPFPVTSRREEVPAAARKEAGGGAACRYDLIARTRQAILSSFTVFSKTVFIGAETFSAALLAAAWKSLACSTLVSTRLRRKEVCSSKTSESDLAPTSASRWAKLDSALARKAEMVLSDRSLETVLAFSKVVSRAFWVS